MPPSNNADICLYKKSILKDKLRSLCNDINYEFSSDKKRELVLFLNDFLGCNELEYDSDLGLYLPNVNTNTNKVKKSAFCGRVFEDGEAVYSCRNCAADPTCVLCESCFKGSNHQGHEVHIHVHGSNFGCCDCGDEEAFEDLVCEHHKKEFKKSFEEIASNLSYNTKVSIECLIEFAFDFIIEVFSLSPQDLKSSLVKESILENTQKVYNHWGLDHKSLNDEVFGLMILNDEAHSYNDVIKIFRTILKFSKSVASVSTRNIDHIGREMAKHSKSIDELTLIAQDILKHKLGVSIRSFTSLFFEEVAGFLIHYIWLITNPKLKEFKGGDFMDYFLETLSRKLINYDNQIETYYTSFSQVNSENLYSNQSITSYHSDIDLRHFEDISMDFFPFSIQIATSSSNNSYLILPKKEWKFPNSRLNKLFNFDSRFWKIVQLELKEIYTRSLLSSSSEYKVITAKNFAVNYPEFSKPRVDLPELTSSLLEFSVQLFTVPSVSKALQVELDFLRTLTYIVESFYHPQVSNVEDYASFSKKLPPLFDCSIDAFETEPLASIYHDFSYFFDHESVSSAIYEDHVLLAQILNFLSRFQGLHPIKRLTQIHIEFEDKKESVAINTISRFKALYKDYTSLFGHSLPHLIKAVRRTIQKIASWIFEGGDFRSENITEGLNGVIYHDIDDGFGNINTIVKFSPGEGKPVSYYYTLNLFLGNLLKYIAKTDIKEFQGLGCFDLIQVLLGPEAKNEFIQPDINMLLLAVFDYPIRSLVLFSQTEANYWVRNGPYFSSIGRYLSDRSFSTIMPILSSIQFMFGIFSPEVVLQTLIERFELTYWFTNETLETSYDSNQENLILVNFFKLIIYCISERSPFLNTDVTSKLRHEVIQCAYKQVSFNVLSTSLSSEIAKDPSLLNILRELCDYKPPELSEETGKYCLKKEYIHLLNPFSYFYSQNDRDVTELLKKNNINDNDIYFKPKLDKIPDGPFMHIGDFLHSKSFCKMIFYGLFNCFLHPSTRSSILDYILHLYFIASEDENTNFIVKGKRDGSFSPGGLWKHSFNLLFDVNDIADVGSKTRLNCIDVIIRLTEINILSDKKDKLTYLLNLFKAFSGPQANETIDAFLNEQKNEEEIRNSEVEETKRKMEAKERREKVKKMFSNAQQKFVETQSSLYDEIDEVDGELNDQGEAHGDIPRWKEPYITGDCIICQEKGSPEEPYGVIGLIQSSQILSSIPLNKVNFSKDHAKNNEENQDSAFSPNLNEKKLYQLDESSQYTQYPPSSELSMEGFNISSCGHILHISCLKTTIIGEDLHSFTLNYPSLLINDPSNEFICPLCNSLNNIILPVFENPGLKHDLKQNEAPAFSNWLESFLAHLGTKIDDVSIMKDEELDTVLLFKNKPYNELDFVKIPGTLPRAFTEQPDEMYNPEICLSLDQFTNIEALNNGIIDSFKRILRTFHCYYVSSPFNGLKGKKRYGSPKGSLEVLLYSLAYTINIIEMTDRFKFNVDDNQLTPFILDRISTINRDLLTLLWNNILSLHQMLGNDSVTINKKRVDFRFILLKGLANKQSIFDEDPFLLLIEFSLEYLNKNNIDIFNFIGLLLLIQTVKVMVGCYFGSMEHPPEGSEDSEYKEMPVYFKNMYKRLIVEVFNVTKDEVEELVEKGNLKFSYGLIYSSLVAFLRKCSIFVNACQLKVNRYTSFDSELEYLIHSLSLPSLEEILNSLFDSDLIKLVPKWICSLEIENQIKVENPYPYQLLKLPSRIDLLYNICDEILIKTCKPSAYGHAICLFCGQVICQSQVCCSDTETPWDLNHQQRCSGPIGVFLLPKKAKLYLVYRDLRLYINAPYLTLHGEVYSSNSGLPLHLQKDRYDNLKLSILRHDIPNLVVRARDRRIPEFFF
ncbi:hypothetical protein K502DRAFT_362886 [Neoconidiobolus thromboides FSU 785]|nr:hypothetical protein K502DRAFT_362886 [Neoconidiobolus thromboides FSU 785]